MDISMDISMDIHIHGNPESFGVKILMFFIRHLLEAAFLNPLLGFHAKLFPVFIC